MGECELSWAKVGSGGLRPMASVGGHTLYYVSDRRAPPRVPLAVLAPHDGCRRA
jgi:hypothetical protein